ncbi:MAG: YceD family protein [Gemmatimonadota bacterium]
MLRVDLRELARGPVETRGELKQDDPALEGADISLREPVVVSGRLQAIGEGRFYWQGKATTVIQGECRRCLTPVSTPLNLEIGALFTQDAEALDDPDSYAVAPDATEVDVTPAVREELLLAAPRYVECREDCKGLCPQCGKDLNAGPCGCAPATDARWQPLKALKDKLGSNN